MLLIRVFLVLLTGGIGATGCFSAPNEAVRWSYAVIVSQSTISNTYWNKVAEALAVKHQAQVLTYDRSPKELLSSLQKLFPRYACFVAQPEEATRDFVAEVHQMTRKFDEDPFTDCFWGILTGYDADNALRIAQYTEPLVIRKVAAGTDFALNMVEEGVWYCELVQNRMVTKQAGQSIVQGKGPDDTTLALVNTLNEYHADLFITSGHATERDWQIGFRYRNGYFKHQDGHIFGVDTKGQKHPIHSTNPKVYMPIGNCLMGHIDQRDCMATAWMNSAGVKQMLGYTVPTWYGYQGWGVLDYFVEQPGRYTFTEAFFANNHALIHRLNTYFPELIHANCDANGRLNTKILVSAKAKADGLASNDARGLVFDRDFVAFYGDPAWQARMDNRPKAFDLLLSHDSGRFTLDIKPNLKENSFKAINMNGVQRGDRPFIAYLPYRMKEIQIIEGQDLAPVITDDFVLIPNPRICDPNKNYRVIFQAKP